MPDETTTPQDEPVEESAAHPVVFLSDGSILESADSGAGWNWRVQLISSGISKNRTEYPLSTLHKRADLYVGVPMHYGGKDHDPNHRGFSDVGGWITEARPNSRGLEGVVEINRGKPELRETFLHAFDVYQRTGRLPFGFSHVVPSGKYKSTVRRLAEGLVRRIDDFTAVDSVDLVMRPSAGGELIGLVAAVDEGTERSLATMDELLARIRKGETLSEAELTQLATEAPGELAKALAAAPTPEPVQESVQPEPDNGELSEAERRFEERIKQSECRLMLAEALAESKLPVDVQDAIKEDFAGTIFDQAMLTKRIERDRTIAAKIAKASGAGMPHTGKVEVSQDEMDRKRKAMDGMMEGKSIDGVEPYRSIKQAYIDISGHGNMSFIDGTLPYMALGEAAQYGGSTRGPLQEALDSTSWAEVLGDSITRRMIAEYTHPNFQSWRVLVTDVVPLSDFRTQRRTRFGGYGDLPIVAEGATYQPTDSPPDEEATYVPNKRGYLESLTLEIIANDDVGALRRLPVKMGRAAARTLYYFMWNTMFVDNPTMTYDSVALFDNAAHGNSGTTALSATALLAVENAMRNQTPYGESGHKLGAGNMPVTLVIPNGLRETAFRLTQSGVMSQASSFDATEPNMFQGRYNVVVVDDLTDVNDWYALANPQDTPIIELGFLNGREEPELFVQDQPTVGSNFTADKVTYKIRHIYGAANLDHRGVYRQVVT